MDYVKLGRTGLEVSKVCLGCMTFGAPDRGGQPWSFPEAESRPIFKHAIDLGINFFDTANIYSIGTSEEITGKILREMLPDRESYVLATKVHGRMRPGPNGMGLSRKHIMAEMDASLKRLGMDYVDLYQIHRFHPGTPIEETMEALHDLVKAGKTRYIGASSMWAWQFAKMQQVAERHGWTKFVAMQNHYNVIYREEEREMMPLCADQGVGSIPWSPLARGRAFRPWNEQTHRSKLDDVAIKRYDEALGKQDAPIVAAVNKIAKDRGVPGAQIALAWVWHKPPVASPIIGATKTSHLDDAAAASTIKLTDSEIKALEAPYTPHAIQGH